MAETECPGACNYRCREARDAYKQALAAYDPLDPKQSRPEPPQIKAVPGTPWCSRCQALIRRDLAELDSLAAILAAAADGQRGRRPGAKMPTRKQHGGPSPSPTADLLSELYSALCMWERASLGEPRTRRGFLAAARSEVIARLLDQFDTVIINREAEGIGDGVRWWHRKLKAISKAGTGTHHKPVRCPRCEEMALWWTEGDDHVVCHGKGNTCGRLISMDEYDELAAEQDDARTAAARADTAGAGPARPAA